MLADEGRQDVSDLLLLASRKARGGFEQLPHLAGRAALAGGRCIATGQDRLDRGAERLGQAGKDFRGWRRTGPLPETDIGQRDANTFGQLLLRKPGLSPKVRESGSNALTLYSTPFHARIIYWHCAVG